MRSFFAAMTFVAMALPVRIAVAEDAAGALEELKAGYALKVYGNCREAIPHLTRSFELDAKPKAALNLADCEQQLGYLVEARDHAALGRALAHQLGDAELVGVADKQLGSVEKRLPLLTLRLAGRAPTGCTIKRDGSIVEMTSLGVPVGVNPGTHAISLSAPGYMDRRFRVTIGEGQFQEITLEPGPKLGAPATPAFSPLPPVKKEPLAEAAPATSPETYAASSSPNVLVYGAYGALGLGAVGLIVGVVAGLVAVSKHDALVNECNGNDCFASAQGDLNDFHSLKTVSTVGYVVGAVGLAAGGAIWLFSLRDRSTGQSANLWVGPSSAGVGGVF
jgi:hypothetical protein